MRQKNDNMKKKTKKKNKEEKQRCKKKGRWGQGSRVNKEGVREGGKKGG